MTDLTDRTTIDAAATAAGWAIEERGDWDAEHDQTTVDYTRGEHLTITAYYGQRGRQLGYAELYVPDFDSSTGGRFADDTDRRRFPRRPAQTPAQRLARVLRWLDTDHVTPAKLAAVLDLEGEIPWDSSELFLGGVRPPVRPISLLLRSEKTVGEMIDDMPELQRARKRRECEQLGTPADSHDEIGWTIRRPRVESDFFRRMTFHEWIAHEAAKLPAGYLPARLDSEELLVRALGDQGVRDDAIRQALADGVAVAELVERTGLSRARIYQIRDRRR